MASASSSSSNGMTACDGPEDLLARGAHLVAHPREDRGRVVVTAGEAVGRAAAADEVAALGDRQADVPVDLLPVGALDERADLRRVVLGVADHEAAGGRREALEEGVVDLALDEQARAGQADLAVVGEDRPDRAGHGLVQIGVGEHDVRAAAAELARHRDEVLRGRGGDRAAGRALAGERDPVDAGIAR